MATRFYLPNSGIAPISPSFNAVWDQTGQADRIFMPRKLTLSSTDALTDKTVTVPITTSQQILMRQYISEPLEAQTIILNSQLIIIIRGAEDVATTNASPGFLAYFVSGDGSTVRGVFKNYGIGIELSTTPTAFQVTAGLSAVTCQKGDRIVFEVGVDAATPTSAGTATFRFGDNATSDFTADGQTTDLNPWIQFSQDLIFLSTTFGNYDPYFRVGSGLSRSERAS